MVPVSADPSETRPPPTDRKTTLFCECGREGPLPDWPVRERPSADGDREVLTCPACARVVVSQPVLAAPA